MLSKKRVLGGSVFVIIGLVMILYTLEKQDVAGLYFLLFYPGVILFLFGLAVMVSPEPDMYIESQQVEEDPDIVPSGRYNDGRCGPSNIYEDVGDPFMPQTQANFLSRDQPFHDQIRKRD